MITKFSVNYRNTGHWDVWDEIKGWRFCKIRGKEGNVTVYKDNGFIKDKKGFKDVASAMKYICNQLMKKDRY